MSIHQAVDDIMNTLGSTFCGFSSPAGLRTVPIDPLNLYPKANSADLLFDPFVGDASHYTRIGSLYWHQCLLVTSSSKAQYDGPELFHFPAFSSAFSFAADGNIRTAREILRKQLAKKMTPFEDRTYWLALASTYCEEDDYGKAIDVFEEALAQHPAWFKEDEEFWERWADVYQMNNDLEGAVKRFNLALTKSEGKCWKVLSRIYAEDLDDCESALALLQSMSEGSHPELTAGDWYEIGQIYDDMLNQPELAVRAFKNAIDMDNVNKITFDLPKVVAKYSNNLSRGGSEESALISALAWAAPWDQTWRMAVASRYTELCNRMEKIDRATSS